MDVCLLWVLFVAR